MLSPTSFYSGCLYFPKYLSLFSNFPFHQVELYETADIWSFLAYKKLQFHTMQPNIWNSGTERENELYSSIHVTFRHSTNIYSAQSKSSVLNRITLAVCARLLHGSMQSIPSPFPIQFPCSSKDHDYNDLMCIIQFR